MFEKSLYDLIRGLRARKGDERAYILESLKECRNEVKSQDGDIKATAILKLIYLEMFGHDMSWASFHVLEVMSSTKFLQKRIGYLAAVQSFTLETDVLMLATNLLKKDLSSSSPYDVSLALNGLSHIVSPSLARDLSTDLMTKLTHTNPYIRKKAILVLYKCFLQSPELLRTAWPRLREGLNDEDPSVVNATVNVICELARKNPRNYLPLAPKLFGLLTGSGNNWMTIKIIKLFATLTPLEPRLTKKLVPPITNLIRTTSAMSLLYECINGLISGGLLASMGDTEEGEELASVCVTKLRGFLVEGDSNLKYVGLLAFTKIVATHAHLVALHQDVILDCIDDPDISIRLRALELVVGMVNSDSLQVVVGRLMRQLRSPNILSTKDGKDGNDIGSLDTIGQYEVDRQEEDPYTGTGRPARGSVRSSKRKPAPPPPPPPALPTSYKTGVIKRILEMCSRDLYANVTDFEWYLDVLIQLVRFAPPVATSLAAALPGEFYDGGTDRDYDGAGDDDDGDALDDDTLRKRDVGEDIGFELRNVAVRVKSVRASAVAMADLLVRRREGLFPPAGGGGQRVLLYAGWLVGEYAALLPDPEGTVAAMVNPGLLPPDILAIYIQSVPKLYAVVTGDVGVSWTAYRKSSVTLLTESVVRFLEPHATAPDVQVQERAVEFLELFKLAGEAIAAQPTAESGSDGYDSEPPRLLTQAIPAMFMGMELGPVAPTAQRKVPVPQNLDLDAQINPQLDELLAQAAMFSVTTTNESYTETETDTDDEIEFQKYYYQRHLSLSTTKQYVSAAAALEAAVRGTSPGRGPGIGTYQYQTSSSPSPNSYLDPDIVARRKAEKAERHRDDPFYISDPMVSSPNTLPVEEVDVDSIPVMPLNLSPKDLIAPPGSELRSVRKAAAAKPEIVRDEEVEGELDTGAGAEKENELSGSLQKKSKKKKPYHHPLLGPQGAGLVGFSIEEDEADKKGKGKAKDEVEEASGGTGEAGEREIGAGEGGEDGEGEN
ncbi:adaptin N terminal region-domain-containing protein [Kalaharituber pfeilii]|nr:adaptin N terminal region-domain-containing protein [Kalaharituber pfeilii]